MYLQKQESFLVDVIRRCMEAETRLVQVSKELSDTQQSLSVVNEQVTQLLSGLEATTKERDHLREEHSRYRDEILSLGDLKEKCEKIEKNHEDNMKNYHLVNESYQKLGHEHEQLKAELEKLQQQSDKKSVNKVVKLDQAKKDDWCQ